MPAIALLFVTGCASIVSGTKQEVAFRSTPPGATVTVDGENHGGTPMTLKLSRKSRHEVSFALDGYQPYEMSLTKSLNGWYFGNILFGGIIGLVVDAANGAMYKLTPKQVEAMLGAAEVHSTGDLLHIAVVMTPDPSWERIHTFERSR
jgi:diacylglycerol kinase family enzyme